MNIKWLFQPKFKVAIFCKNQNIINNISNALKKIFDDKICIEFYGNTHDMFVAINVAKAKNCPFNIAIIGSQDELEARIVLQRSNPSMEVISYVDDATLRSQTQTLYYKH